MISEIEKEWYELLVSVVYEWGKEETMTKEQAIKKVLSIL